MDYCRLDELDVKVEGASPRLEENHEELKAKQEAYQFNMLMEEMNYRIWHHNFFPEDGKRRRKKKWRKRG